MTYKMFICHAYDHQDIYFKLVQKLNAIGFDWRNQSVQYDMRYGHAEEELDHDELRKLIGSKIADSDVLLALTKPIASRRAWLQWEIKLAKALHKPIIGVARYRNDRVSKFVRDNADEIVDTWRIDHIINAIEWSVAEYRDRAHAQPVPKSLPRLVPSPPDEDMVAVPSPASAPPPPPDVARVEAVADAIEATTTPREVLFRELGDVVPGQPTFLQLSPPRWWQRWSRRPS